MLSNGITKYVSTIHTMVPIYDVYQGQLQKINMWNSFVATLVESIISSTTSIGSLIPIAGF